MVLTCMPFLQSINTKTLFRGKQSFMEKKFSCPFQTLSETPSDFGKSFLIAFSTLHNTHPDEPFVQVFPDVQWTNLSFLDILKKNLDDFSKPHSIGPKGSPWRKKIYTFKKQFFSNLSGLGAELSWTFGWKISSVAKFPFAVPGGTFWGEQCL